MLHINIICIGKIKETFFKDSIDEYSKRLSKYCSLNIVELPDEKIPTNPSDKEISIIKDKEGAVMPYTTRERRVIHSSVTGSAFSICKYKFQWNKNSLN